MKHLLFVLSICLNCYSLFFLSKKYKRTFLLKAFPALIPIIIVVFFVLGLIVKLLGVQMDFSTSQLLISAMMSLVVISLTNFINQLFLYMVDAMVAFHLKNNTANIGRQPIKFFIDYQIQLKRVATVIWSLGAALMLYGVWLADQP
jgi:hypothetical protein